MSILEDLSQAIIIGNKDKAVELTNRALSDNITPIQIINEGLIKGMDVVGTKFRCNEYYIPNVLISARAMKSAMAIIKPLLAEGEYKYKGKVVIGTVKGDLHDIGKNIVSMMMEGAGFQVIDLGVDVSPEKFVETIKAQSVDVLAMSALLTTTMVNMRGAVELLEKEGIRDKVKVIVGGAPLTQRFADEIKADGYAPDASSGVEKAKQLLNA
jgi:5-methyltetrahydrofolate--homocysteine methyltransferase